MGREGGREGGGKRGGRVPIISCEQTLLIRSRLPSACARRALSLSSPIPMQSSTSTFLLLPPPPPLSLSLSLSPPLVLSSSLRPVAPIILRFSFAPRTTQDAPSPCPRYFKVLSSSRPRDPVPSSNEGIAVDASSSNADLSANYESRYRLVAGNRRTMLSQ